MRNNKIRTNNNIFATKEVFSPNLTEGNCTKINFKMSENKKRTLQNSS